MPHMHGTVNEVTRGSKAHQRRLMMTLTLTGTVFVAEIVGAIITGSLALLVDAGHMLTDMSVLIASTVTAVLMRRKPNSSRTWGWARLEVLTAEAGAMILLFVGLYALIEAGMRLFGGSAEHVADSGLLLFFGILGLAANVGSIIILAGQHNDNMNMKAAFLEVVNDALGSVAVIASAVVMMLTGWDGFDAIAGGLIALLMIPRAVKLLRDALKASGDDWETLMKPARKAPVGTVIDFGDGLLKATVTKELEHGGRMIHFDYDGIFMEILDKLGETPLPPYIKEKLEDPEMYQTVYSKELGSAAAPTAGLHWTKELLQKVQDKGVKLVYLTLHVGLGTFRPVVEENIEAHKMHSEFYRLTPEAAATLNEVRDNGGRIIATGTTSIYGVEDFAEFKEISDKINRSDGNVT